jgi:hypothetical protein
LQHLPAACLVWQIMLTKTITSGRSLCLLLLAWSWPDSRVPLFELRLCTAAFFDQVLVSNSEDLYWAAHVTSRISWSFMNLYRTSYVRCGCGDVLLLDACQSHLRFVFQGRCFIFGCLEFLDLNQQTYTECSPFCYWEPELKYSPSSLMIREHHQRCAKLFLRAWQTWILGSGFQTWSCFADPNFWIIRFYLRSFIILSSRHSIVVGSTHWNFFGTAWQATAGPANQSSIPAAETSHNVFLKEKRCVHNFSWIKIMGSTTRAWWRSCVKIDSKTSRLKLQAIRPLHLSINLWHCWCS